MLTWCVGRRRTAIFQGIKHKRFTAIVEEKLVCFVFFACPDVPRDEVEMMFHAVEAPMFTMVKFSRILAFPVFELTAFL